MNPSALGGGGGFTLYVDCKGLGTGRNTEVLLLVFLLALTFRLEPKLWIFCSIKGANEQFKLLEICNFYNLYKNSECQVTFSISKNTAGVDRPILSLKFEVTWSISLIFWSDFLRRARKLESFALSSLCLWFIFNVSLSNSLLVMDNG